MPSNKLHCIIYTIWVSWLDMRVILHIHNTHKICSSCSTLVHVYHYINKYTIWNDYMISAAESHKLSFIFTYCFFHLWLQMRGFLYIHAHCRYFCESFLKPVTYDADVIKIGSEGLTKYAVILWCRATWVSSKINYTSPLSNLIQRDGLHRKQLGWLQLECYTLFWQRNSMLGNVSAHLNGIMFHRQIEPIHLYPTWLLTCATNS